MSRHDFGAVDGITGTSTEWSGDLGHDECILSLRFYGCILMIGRFFTF